MKRYCMILGACLLLLPGEAFAIGVIGRIIVKIEGFQGWHQTRDRDLEIKVTGVPGFTRKAGAFLIEDLGVFGRKLSPGEVASFDDAERNFVRLLVGRHRIVLPVEWRGRVIAEHLVLDPVRCEVLANGTGACFIDQPPSPSYANVLRRQVGLPELDDLPASDAAPSSAVVAPKASDFVERPVDGSVIDADPPDIRRSGEVQQPSKTKNNKSDSQLEPDTEVELEIVEPID